jgi:hypothetical protein
MGQVEQRAQQQHVVETKPKHGSAVPESTLDRKHWPENYRRGMDNSDGSFPRAGAGWE